MIKTANNANKLYNVIEAKFRDFDYDGWPDAANSRDFWERFLTSKGIKPRHFDTTDDAVDELMDMVNSATNALVCADPWINENADGDGFLEIPTDLAEKILVLGYFP
jgi:hypothetical protein